MKMNRVQEIKHWLEEGNLYRAEKAIQNCSNDLKPSEKEEFEKLLSEICIQKLKEKNAPVEGLQNSLNQIVSERRTIRSQKMLIVLFGLITLIFFALFILA